MSLQNYKEERALIAKGVKSTDLKRRAGRFEVPDYMVEHDEDARQIINCIMAKVFVVRCEHDYARRMFVYHAYSFLFDVVEEGCEAPTYQFISSPDGVTVERKTAPRP